MRFRYNRQPVICKRYGGRDIDIGIGIALDEMGNIYVTGIFDQTADFDPSTGTAILGSAGSSDIYAAKYDNAGNYIFAKAMGGPGGENVTAIAVNAAGNIYLTGYFGGKGRYCTCGSRNCIPNLGKNPEFICCKPDQYGFICRRRPDWKLLFFNTE